MSLLGVQGWLNAPGGAELVEWVARVHPPILKILEPQAVSDGWHEEIRKRSPRTIVVWRFVGFFGDRQGVLGMPITEAAEAARQHARELLPYLIPRLHLFDIVETLNEPGFSETLVAYEMAFARECLPHQIRVGCFAFSTGTPPESAFSHLRNLPLLPNQILAPHEYAWQNRLDSPYHIGRVNQWRPYGARFYIGETGQEPGGWRTWGDGNLQSLLPLIDTAYSGNPECLGVILFCWNSPGGGQWENFAIWNTGLDRWLAEYLQRNPPYYRRHLLSIVSSSDHPLLRPGDVVRVLTYLNLRQTPAVRSDNRIRVLSPGELLLVCEVQDGWIRASALSDRRVGWCAIRYVEPYARCGGR